MTGRESAIRGKLYELSVGFHLNNGNDVVTISPQKTKISVMTNEIRVNYNDYEKLDKHAKQASEQIKTELDKNGHGTIDEVAWVANGKTYEYYTGIESAGAKADLMLRLQSTDMSQSYNLVGISLKYNKNTTTLRNTSISSFAEKMDISSIYLVSYHINHLNTAKMYGFTGNDKENHEKWRLVRDEPIDTPLGKISAIIKRSSNESRKDIAREIAKHLKNMDQKTLVKRLIDYICPLPNIPEYQASTCPVSGETVISCLRHEIEKIFSDIKTLDVFVHNGTTCYVKVNGKKVVALEVVNKGRPLKKPEVKPMICIK